MRDRRPDKFLDGRDRLHVSGFSGTAGRDDGLVFEKKGRERRRLALLDDHAKGEREAGTRTQPDRETRACRLFPDGLGYLTVLPRQQYSLAGPRLGGKLGSLLLARHHGRRPDRGRSFIRKILIRG